MKKVYHIINIILSIAIGGLGILLMTSPNEMLLQPIAGAMAFVLGIISLIMGALFPKEENQSSNKIQQLMNISIVNHTSKNSPTTAQKTKMIKRSWEPLVPFIWGILEGLVGIFVIVEATDWNQFLMIAILTLIVLLFITSILWKVEDNKQHYGERKTAAIFYSIIIVIAIFSIAGIIGYFKTENDLRNLNLIETPDIVDQNTDDIETAEIESYTLNQLLNKISKDFNGQKLYYKLQNKNDESANLIIWNDIDEDVVIYALDKKGDDSYQINFTMLSNNLKHADVQGKEDGIILEADNQN